jgi:hypothetical protein
MDAQCETVQKISDKKALEINDKECMIKNA